MAKRKEILPLRRQTFNGLIKNPSSDSHITIAMSLAGMFEEKGLANRRATIRTPKKIVNIPATLFTNLGVGIPFGK